MLGWKSDSTRAPPGPQVTDIESVRCFTDFYSLYLHERRHPTTKLCHFLGTALALWGLLWGVVNVQAFWLVLGSSAGSSLLLKWGSLFLVERRWPRCDWVSWTMLADLRLFVETLTGRHDVFPHFGETPSAQTLVRL